MRYLTLYVAPGRYNSGKYWCEYRIGPTDGYTVVQRKEGSWTEDVGIRREGWTLRTSYYSEYPRIYCNVYVPVTWDADPNFARVLYLDPSR